MKVSAHLILVDDDSAVRGIHGGNAARARLYPAAAVAPHSSLLERRANVDLMLIDFAMPGMSGAEVARRAHMTRPALPILFVTGYADGPHSRA